MVNKNLVARVTQQVKDLLLGESIDAVDSGRVQIAAVLQRAVDGSRIDTAYEEVLDGIIAALGEIKKERKDMNRDMDLADARHQLSKRVDK